MGKKKNKDKKTKHISKKKIQDGVFDILKNAPETGLTYRQIASLLGLKKESYLKRIADYLLSLAEQDLLIEVKKGKYKLNDRGIFVVGQFERKNNGKNQLIPTDSENPIFVAERNSNHALNGDTVKVQMFAKRKGRTPEGEVIEIIKRAKTTFVGKIQLNKHFAFLVTESKILSNDIFIPENFLKEAKNGDKAIVQIIEWPDHSKNPIGKVVDVLGQAGENNTEIHAILAEYGLPYKYPENLEKAADKISDKITKEEISKRIDFRDITTFTIDPKDAKDFDDALSIQKLENGNWEVGVHIADVTYYVKPKDIIDQEAEARATSVYLVDRVVPMLPERLCNQICSLRPQEEKLCFSCIFTLNEEATIIDSKIARTVINSNRRFAYEEAQDILEKGEGEYAEELLTLDKLAKILRKKRFTNGSINFERSEVRFEIDKDGRPLSVYFKESKDANKLIEEFMLLANKTVAEFIGKPTANKKAKTFVYRIHDQPDATKMESLGELIRRFGYSFKSTGSNLSVSRSINTLLADVQGKKEENLIQTVAIRAMAKAVYTTTNIGHYGLAFDYYTHFTSPIRRYPDMMVHRLLARYLAGGSNVAPEQWEELCEHSSAMEQTAASAERSSIKYKQVEYMKERLGETYKGVISGVTEWGLYVELNENKCEGLIPIRELDDDYYDLDEKTFSLIGRRKKKIYRLGDEITIKVASANLERKQLDFQLIEKGDFNK